jgi:hypothetical protein
MTMKPELIFLILALLLTSSSSVAQCGDGQDEICIFWSLDSSECFNCAFSLGEPLQAFVVLINASQDSGVGGFEFKLVNGDGSNFPAPYVFVLDTSFRPRPSMSRYRPSSWSDCPSPCPGAPGSLS